MSGSARLVLSILRRDRWQLLLWVAGITALAGVSALAVVTEFSGERERTELVTIAVTNPAFLFLRGTPDGVSVGSVYFFQGFTILAVLAGLMSTFLVVRNTRAEEESGRAELLGSLPLRREVPMLCAVAVAALTNLVLAGTVALVLILAGLDATGALLTGGALAATGVVFAGVAALAAQAMPTARAANGVAGGLVGVGYLLRGMGDALGTPSATLTSVEPEWMSWLSPIGWAQRVSPFGQTTTALFLLHLAAAIVLVALAATVARRRDLDASIVQDRPGPATASALRGTATGAAWVLQVPTIVGWTAGTAVLAALVGVLAPTVLSALEDNPSLKALMETILRGGGADLVDVFASTILGVCGILAAAAGIQAVLRLHAEEADGRAELLLAAPYSRGRWLLGHALVASVTIVIMMVVAGFAAGIAFVLMGEGGDRVSSSLSATLAQIPAALTLLAVAALAFAIVPRVAQAIGWGALVLAVILKQFGDLLQLPDWVQDISPLRHTSALPLDDFDPLPALVMVAAALLAVGVAAVFIERRDIPS